MAPKLVSFGCLLLMFAVDLSSQSKAPGDATGKETLESVAGETAQLKQTVAELEKRVAELEKTVKALQETVAPPPKPIPSPMPPWQASTSWGRIRPGMSETDVVAILGAATRVQSVTDMRILFYGSDASALSGSVTLMDDRVIAATPPAF